MRVLIDTCVWSNVLRHKNQDQNLLHRVNDLVADGHVAMIGLIRQEILSGVSDEIQFQILKEKLDVFDDIPLKSEYFIQAAHFFNVCRKKGIQGSAIDFLICSVAHSLDLSIFTTDGDFNEYKKILKVKLF